MPQRQRLDTGSSTTEAGEIEAKRLSTCQRLDHVARLYLHLSMPSKGRRGKTQTERCEVREWKEEDACFFTYGNHQFLNSGMKPPPHMKKVHVQRTLESQRSSIYNTVVENMRSVVGTDL